MYAKLILVFVSLVAFQSQIGTALYLKRAEFEDPRMFSASFGKRSTVFAPELEDVPIQKYHAIRLQRRDDFDDPRLLSMAFGKRSYLPTLEDLHRYTIYDKRGADLDDPRFFSGAFGRK
uniref:Uncharacterized protein n=1 Tax=Caenorhabditis japonica TaxID=281687 RepID=A0A8R1EFR9_CAEJA